MTGRMLDRALTAVERLLFLLVGLRAALLRRRRGPAAREAARPRCRSCGCDDAHACIEIAFCGWTGRGLCSSCAEGPDPLRELEGRL